MKILGVRNLSVKLSSFLFFILLFVGFVLDWIKHDAESSLLQEQALFSSNLHFNDIPENDVLFTYLWIL